MNVLLFILTFIMVVFIGTLIHELGHVCGAKMGSFKNIRLSIGTGMTKCTFRLFNIECVFHHLFFVGGYTSYNTKKGYNPLDIAFVAMMGPLFNGLTVFLLITFTNIYLHYSLYLFFLFNAWLLIANIFPFKWNEKQSDGYVAIQSIRKHMHIQAKK